MNNIYRSELQITKNSTRIGGKIEQGRWFESNPRYQLELNKARLNRLGFLLFERIYLLLLP